MPEYTFEIEQDEGAESPREWDNLGIFCLDHKRRDLPWELSGLSQSHPMVYSGGYVHQCHNWEEVRLAIIQTVKQAGDEVAVILPVFAYDHSVFALSTRIEPTWFHAAWDSGRVGFIFVTKSRLRQEFNTKRISKKRLEMAAEVLKGEVETYSRWLNGWVYAYVIKDEDGDVVDSCGGFYDTDHAVGEAQNYIDHAGG